MKTTTLHTINIFLISTFMKTAELDYYNSIYKMYINNKITVQGGLKKLKALKKKSMRNNT